jgi:hypothetical protein
MACGNAFKVTFQETNRTFLPQKIHIKALTISTLVITFLVFIQYKARIMVIIEAICDTSYMREIRTNKTRFHEKGQTTFKENKIILLTEQIMV